MDWTQAIHYARLVQAAEAVVPAKSHGPRIKITSGSRVHHYDVLATIYANDLATESNPKRQELTVSFGYIAQNTEGDVVVALRGTHGIHEWLHDCNYHAVPCHIIPDSGHTEDGFTQIYKSLRIAPDPQSTLLPEAFANMHFPRPIHSITIAGHSLGAALATFFALDLAANTQYKDVELYTYASPRIGDHHFAETFKKHVPRTHRIANRMDIITEVPPALLTFSLHAPYRHVEDTHLLVPGHEIGHHIVCMHHVSTYLYLMLVQMGETIPEHTLIPECCRINESAWVRLLERHHL